MTHYSGESHVNVGYGSDVSILEVAELICNVVGFRGKIVTDSTKPDGTPRKLLDSRELRALGWRPRIELTDGLAGTHRWFENSLAGDARNSRAG